MDYMKELESKRLHDHLHHHHNLKRTSVENKKDKTTSLMCDDNHSNGPKSVPPRRVLFRGPIIIGAGPAGLAVAARLKQLGIPRLVLERSSCIASLWQLRTYDRLRLHLPKKFCELPDFPFPPDFPIYPTKQHFIAYLEAYAKHFGIKPVFGMTVVGAEFDVRWGMWRVAAVGDGETASTEYVSRWVVAATGENAEAVVPEVDGAEGFEGRVLHSSEYKCGEEFRGKRVLVVGCGNSGMEVSLDLWNHGASPSLVVRDTVHVLPQEMLGSSTFGLSMRLLKCFPIRLVDRFLLIVSHMVFGSTDRFGLRRPAIGPFELKSAIGKTPVLDIGTLAQIRAGNIKVFPGIRRIVRHGAEFVDARAEDFDAIIFATGFRSNVPSWLKGSDMFSQDDGFPIKSFPDGWKGANGLYAAGFSKRGISGLSLDSRRIAEDINNVWKSNKEQLIVAHAHPKLSHLHTELLQGP
ncbi:hypothetical protein V2J09_000295 [Rumex salicifolius]